MNNELWESMLTPKECTGQSPYLLVYGKEFVLRFSLEINALTMVYEIEKENQTSQL